MLSRLSYGSNVSYAQDIAKQKANARSFIWYNMDGFTKSIDSTISLTNKGSAGSRLNAEAFASNHVYLTGTQNTPYVISGGTSVAYYDVATKSFVTDTASNPYTVTTSHSVLFSYTSTLTDADKTALNADPNLAFRMFFDGEVLPSGFSRANDMVNCDFYGGNKGTTNILRGEVEPNLRYSESDIGATNYLYPSTLSDNTDLGYTRSSVTGMDGVANSAIRMTEDTTTSQRRFRDTTDSTISAITGDYLTVSIYVKVYGDRNQVMPYLEVDGTASSIEVDVSTKTVHVVAAGTNTFVGATIEDWDNGYTRITATWQLGAATSNIALWMFFSNLVGNANGTYTGDGVSYLDFFRGQVEINKYPSALIETTTVAVNRSGVDESLAYTEIQDYDSATRTTLANQSYGASNLKLIRDGSGRTTGTALANTTQWEADGRTAVTNWTIAAPFTITEIIDGDTYDFTSDGNRYKNTVADGTYTLPTGVWTLDEFGFDGVTPVVARGNTKMIDEVVVP